MPGGNTTTTNQNTNENGNQSSATTQLATQNQQQTQNGSQVGSQTQQSQVGPWSATAPLLQNILSKLGTQSTDPSAAQSNALGMLQNETTGLPNYAPQAAGVANELIGSQPAYTGMLSNAYDSLKGTMGTYLDPKYLNPMNTPGFSDALSTMNNDITNQVNGQFAAAGRDLSPANSTALARGLSQGEGQLIANQFNQNVGAQQGAAGTVYNAGNTTAQGLTNQQQTALANKLQGLGLAGEIPTFATAPGQAALGVANTAQSLPYSNLGMLQQLLLPIAGLGQTSTGTGTTTGATTGNTTGTMTGNQTGSQTGTYSGTGTQNGQQTQQQNPLSTILGGLMGGAGLLGGMGAFGSSGWLNPNSSKSIFG